MSLDLSKLENPRSKDGAIVARCPACALEGRDRTGEHLWIADEGSGPFVCILHLGKEGKEHRKLIRQLVGQSSGVLAFPLDRVDRAARQRKVRSKRTPLIPDLAPLTEEEMMAVAELRGWHSHKGLEILSSRGLLWFADVFDSGAVWPAWLITDSSRRNAQARTFDGALWPKYQCKAKSLPGTDPSWPIGASDIGNRPIVLFCEGQPDFCAALLVAWYEVPEIIEKVAPVCMVGAGNNINADALHLFAGKRIRIPIHNDSEGQGLTAARRWKGQLEAAGACRVDGVNFAKMALTMAGGEQIKDLADYATRLDGELMPGDTVFSGLG